MGLTYQLKEWETECLNNKNNNATAATIPLQRQDISVNSSDVDVSGKQLFMIVFIVGSVTFL